MKRYVLAALCAIVLTSSACGGAQIPDDNYAPAQTIAAAEERDVENSPDAQLHLKLARDQIAEAEKLKADGKEDEAKLLMLKAQADADYALSLLRRKDQEKETAEVVKKLEELRAEMGQE
jgi:hypothetical protein